MSAHQSVLVQHGKHRGVCSDLRRPEAANFPVRSSPPDRHDQPTGRHPSAPQPGAKPLARHHSQPQPDGKPFGRHLSGPRPDGKRLGWHLSAGWPGLEPLWAKPRGFAKTLPPRPPRRTSVAGSRVCSQFTDADDGQFRAQ